MLVGNEVGVHYAICPVAIAEFIVTATISATFYATIGPTLWPIILALVIGGILAAPFTAFATKYVPGHALMILVGSVVIILRLRSLVRARASPRYGPSGVTSAALLFADNRRGNDAANNHSPYWPTSTFRCSAIRRKVSGLSRRLLGRCVRAIDDGRRNSREHVLHQLVLPALEGFAHLVQISEAIVDACDAAERARRMIEQFLHDMRRHFELRRGSMPGWCKSGLPASGSTRPNSARTRCVARKRC